METHLFHTVRIQKGQVCDGIYYIQRAHLVRRFLILRYYKVCLLLAFNTRLHESKLLSDRGAQDAEAGRPH